MTAYVHATATRWVSDEPFPGIVEVALVDGHGQIWTFLDKSAMFEPKTLLLPSSSYPMVLRLACLVLHGGPDGITVSTAEPWGLFTIDGTSEFVMRPDQVEED
jgi:hypothetical protein